MFLEISQNSRPATFLKKRLWHRFFTLNFAKFLKTLLLIEHLWWQLLCYISGPPNLKVTLFQVESFNWLTEFVEILFFVNCLWKATILTCTVRKILLNSFKMWIFKKIIFIFSQFVYFHYQFSKDFDSLCGTNHQRSSSSVLESPFQ